MDTLWLISHCILWLIILIWGFLLVGVLRSLGLLSWRLEQLAATTPSHLGRVGLRPGTRAPDFTLRDTSGKEMTLHEFAGAELLLVFTQPGCASCNGAVPKLNSVHARGRTRVLAINAGDAESSRRWAEAVGARFPVLTQEHRQLSRQYQVFATPFAFLLDQDGVVLTRGLIRTAAHVDHLLAEARRSRASGSRVATAAATQ